MLITTPNMSFPRSEVSVPVRHMPWAEGLIFLKLLHLLDRIVALIGVFGTCRSRSR